MIDKHSRVNIFNAPPLAWASIGGGGQGGYIPPHIFKGAHNIKCPPPPTILGLYDYSLKWGPFFSCELSAGAVWPILPPPPLFSLVREVGDLRWVPLLCVWKIETPKFWSVRVPPPPLPPAHQLFSDLRDFRGWLRTPTKKLCVPPMVWFGLTPMPFRVIISNYDWAMSHVNKLFVHPFFTCRFCSVLWPWWCLTMPWLLRSVSIPWALLMPGLSQPRLWQPISCVLSRYSFCNALPLVFYPFVFNPKGAGSFDPISQPGGQIPPPPLGSLPRSDKKLWNSART